MMLQENSNLLATTKNSVKSLHTEWDYIKHTGSFNVQILVSNFEEVKEIYLTNFQTVIRNTNSRRKCQAAVHCYSLEGFIPTTNLSG